MGSFVGVLEHDSSPSSTFCFHGIFSIPSQPPKPTSAPTSPSFQQDSFKEWVGKGMSTTTLKTHQSPGLGRGVKPGPATNWFSHPLLGWWCANKTSHKQPLLNPNKNRRWNQGLWNPAWGTTSLSKRAFTGYPGISTWMGSLAASHLLSWQHQFELNTASVERERLNDHIPQWQNLISSITDFSLPSAQLFMPRLK